MRDVSWKSKMFGGWKASNPGKVHIGSVKAVDMFMGIEADVWVDIQKEADIAAVENGLVLIKALHEKVKFYEELIQEIGRK